MAVGANRFDQLFRAVGFDEVDGDILYVYACNEDAAAEKEDELALRSSDRATVLQLAKDGALLWRKHGADVSYSRRSPMLTVASRLAVLRASSCFAPISPCDAAGAPPDARIRVCTHERRRKGLACE